MTPVTVRQIEDMGEYLRAHGCREGSPSPAKFVKACLAKTYAFEQFKADVQKERDYKARQLKRRAAGGTKRAAYGAPITLEHARHIDANSLAVAEAKQRKLEAARLVQAAMAMHREQALRPQGEQGARPSMVDVSQAEPTSADTDRAWKDRRNFLE